MEYETLLTIRESISDINSQYMDQLADLEIKISELTAQLEAKDTELARLKRQFSFSFTDSSEAR